jgi:hypothetical protein
MRDTIEYYETPTSEHLHIQIQPNLLEDMGHQALKSGVSKSAFVRSAIIEKLKRLDDENK